MKPIRRILAIPRDGEGPAGPSPALARATALARALGARLAVLDDRRAADTERILAYAESARFDLIVKDADHDVRLQRIAPGSLDWDLLRESTVPLWLAEPGHAELPRRVAVAIDPMHAERGAGMFNDALLSAATRIAGTCAASLRVLTALEDGEAGAPPFARHRAAFEELLERHALTVGDGLLVQGEPGPAIVDAVARLETDLLVVGAMRHRGLDRWQLGATVEFLASRAPCEILGIPADVPSTTAHAGQALRPSAAAP